MEYSSALFDGSDIFYAPGLSWSKPTYAVWKPPARYTKAGYAIKRMRLEGAKGDGRDAERAALCRQYTREMLEWWRGQDHSGPKAGTWGHVIQSYRTGEFSPFRDVKANTREGYEQQLAIWTNIIGEAPISSLNYEAVMKIKKAMETKGRSASYIRRAFTMLRTVAKYGSMTDVPGCDKVSTILSNIRLRTPPKRTIYATRDQVMAIVAEADARGMSAFACGILMQYELILRAVDIRGQWFPARDQDAGIIRDGKRWQDGMTWDMIDRDITTISKVISKTEKSMTEAYDFSLVDLPEIQSRLRLLRNGSETGPVITSDNGMPYSIYGWSQAFRRIRDALGLPSELTAMDLRASGITEAKSTGASPYQIRDAGQHMNLTTSNGYARDRSEGAAKVVQLRKAKP